MGSPLDVYKYDVINRKHIEQESVEENEKNFDKQSTSNSSYIIEGNLNLFDMLEKDQD